MVRPSSLRAARPSFVEGLARVFDFGDTLADPSYAPAFESDGDAFAHDWHMLRADLGLILQSLAPVVTGENGVLSNGFGVLREQPPDRLVGHQDQTTGDEDLMGDDQRQDRPAVRRRNQ
jgi:hypothetical protein